MTPSEDQGPNPIPQAGELDFAFWVSGVLRYWRHIAGVTVIFAISGVLVGLLLWKTSYTAWAQLIRIDNSTVGEFYKPRQFAPQTFVSMVKSPEIAQNVSVKTAPPQSPDFLQRNLQVNLERNSDMVTLGFTADQPKLAVDLANLYAREVVRYTQNLQVKEVSDLNNYYLAQQLSNVSSQIDTLNEQLKAIPAREETFRIAQLNSSYEQIRQKLSAPTFSSSERLMERLELAKEELVSLTSKYTDEHPLVQEQQNKVKSLSKLLEDSLQKESDERSRVLASLTSSEPLSPTGRGESAPQDAESLRIKLQALENNRIVLANKKLEAQLFAQNPPGYCRLFSVATLNDVSIDSCWIKVIALSVTTAAFGFIITFVTVLIYLWLNSNSLISQLRQNLGRKPLSLG